MVARPVVFIVGHVEAQPIAQMFLDEGWFLGETWRSADLIQFTGGSDVSPGLYGERAHKLTHCWPARDAYERTVYSLAKDYGIPMAGICRGAQFLCVMNGGKLWQDVGNHSLTGCHWAYDHFKKEKLPVTSVHHQMMRPRKNTAEILMTANCSTYRERMAKGGVIKIMHDDEPDIEACYYQKTGSLCFQPHPEYKHVNGIDVCRDKYFEYIWKAFYLQGKKED